MHNVLICSCFGCLFPENLCINSGHEDILLTFALEAICLRSAVNLKLRSKYDMKKKIQVLCFISTDITPVYSTSSIQLYILVLIPYLLTITAL